MECSLPAAWTSNRSLHVATHVKDFTGRPSNSARPYPELDIWNASVFFATGVVNPTLHLRLLLLREGGIEPNPDLPVQTAKSQYAVTSHPLSACHDSGISTEPVVASPNRQRALKALFASSVPRLLLRYHLRRPTQVSAYCHADVYSAAQ